MSTMTAETDAKWHQVVRRLQISKDEILTFNHIHFSVDAVTNFSADFINLPENRDDTAPDEAGAQEAGKDDGLGYYDDGVKRTLTDEQIKIFRHSELWELRKQEENGFELNGVDDFNGPFPAEGAEPGTPSQETQPSGSRKSKKGTKAGKAIKAEPRPDLRKRTWDIVDAGLDSLDYD